MRATVLPLIVLLAACGGAATGPSDAGPASATPAPALETSEPPPSAVAAAGTGMSVLPIGSVDGAAFGYLEYLPPGYGDGEPRPLLVFLHGSGEAGAGSDATLELVDDLGIPQLIADGDWPNDRPFVVLAPQYGTEYAESDCDFGNDLAAFLDFAIGHYEVDPARVYLTGISCGAIGMWDYFASHGDDVVAASVPISGHAEWALEEAGCDLAATPPTWAFHGAVDDVVPVVHIEGPMDQIRACDGADPDRLELTVYPDGDHIDTITRTYDLSAGHDIFGWLLEHTKGSAQ